MGKYLVTGMGGSGKTTICQILNKRGFYSLDSDAVEGLARWEDKLTGQHIEVDHTKFVDYKKVSWNWSSAVLNKLLSTHDQLILCGSSSNEFEFFNLFDKVFVLEIDQTTHKSRLERRSSSYGKDTRTLTWIIEEQPRFTKHAVKLGAIPIDASTSPTFVVKQILKNINEPPELA